MSDYILIGSFFLLMAIIFIVMQLLVVFDGATKLKKRCTQKVEAKIVKIDSSVVERDDSFSTMGEKGGMKGMGDPVEKFEHQEPMTKTLFFPVFSYEYNGKTYTAKSKYATNNIGRVGEKQEIFIDPDAPEDLYVPIKREKELNIVFIVFGIFLMAVVTGCMIYFFIR